MIKVIDVRRIAVGILSVFLLAMFIGGCAPKKAPRDPNPYDAQHRMRTGFLEHTVKFQGETLSIISNWYTGRVDNWRRIVDVNPGLKPEKIRLGQVIMIPMEIVVQDQPLTADAVKRFRPTARSTKEQPKDEAGASKEPVMQPDLFDSEPAPTGQPPAGSVTPPSAGDMGDAGLGKSSADAPLPSGQSAGDENSGPAAAVAPGSTPKTEVTPPKPPSKDDAEREKLLDELLSQ